MALYETEAVVIKRTDYGEADKLITLYTKDYGKVRSVVKGIRKSTSKFGAITELFTYLKVILYAKERQELHRLIRGDIISNSVKIRDNLKKLSYCSLFFELLNRVTGERETDIELFHLVLTYLETLEKRVDELSLTLIYLLRLLQISGFAPNFTGCICCRTKFQLRDKKQIRAWTFSPNQSGLICSDCLPPQKKQKENKEKLVYPISRGAILFLQASSEIDLKQAHKLKIDKQTGPFLLNILLAHIKHRLEGDLKSASFLRNSFTISEHYAIHNYKKR